MEQQIDALIEFMHEKKNTSKNTELSYRRDLKKLADYLQKDLGKNSFSEVTSEDLEQYVAHMFEMNAAPTSISRSIASTKALFSYLLEAGEVKEDVAAELKSPKIEKKEPSILSKKDVMKLCWYLNDFHKHFINMNNEVTNTTLNDLPSYVISDMLKVIDNEPIPQIKEVFKQILTLYECKGILIPSEWNKMLDDLASYANTLN